MTDDEQKKSFVSMFCRATEAPVPLPYQEWLALEASLPSLLDVPTGLGKTAAAILAWVWRRRFAGDPFRKQTPRRLVYCLPMRVLVEQTHRVTIDWLKRLGLFADGMKEAHADWSPPEGDVGAHPIAVHLLLGGEEKSDWALWPERDAILIGTQDMLISRTLNRGYAAGRARWPQEFGLLNSDCLWVFDEIQIMDTSLATSLQLDAWRRSLQLRSSRYVFPTEKANHLARPCHSLWMSATMAKHWLERAVDWSGHVDAAWSSRHQLPNSERTDKSLRSGQLFKIHKQLSKAPISALEKPKTKDNRADKADAERKQTEYLKRLAEHIAKAENHAASGLTLIILNTVDRVTKLFELLREQPSLEGVPTKLIHSRFRPGEREEWSGFLSRRDSAKRILISTQVVEAGVDLSAAVLCTELAPWASLVQRFGRCARYPGETGRVIWLDLDLGTDKAPIEHWARPYDRAEIVAAREKLGALADVGLESLYETKQAIDAEPNGEQASHLFPYEPRFVPRDKDLFDLFDTTPDLTGADVDVSRFIRDGEELDVQVFWRDIDGEPHKTDRPQRRELCPVPFHRFREALPALRKTGKIWRRNYRKGWEPINSRDTELVYPGQIFLLEASCGGYSLELGWTGHPQDRVEPVLVEDIDNKADASTDTEDSEDLSELSHWFSIEEHCRDVGQMMATLLEDAGLSDSEQKILLIAARLHDWGKAHQAFQAKLKLGLLALAQKGDLGGQPAAKAPKDAWRRDGIPQSGDTSEANKDKRRPGHRHELASALAILETLCSARPAHEAFSWPEGLNTSSFGEAVEHSATPISTDHPLVQELAGLSTDELDLLVYLVASHHGKVRMSLRSSPDDEREDVPDPCPPDKRQARGVRDGDILPSCRLPVANLNEPAAIDAPAVTLSLAPMELGLSQRYGASWRERTQLLLERFGPFRLGYLEALLRAADCRASREEEDRALAGMKKPNDNGDRELDTSHSELATDSARATAPDSPRAPTAQGGAEHGVRGGAGGSADAGTGARPPRAATRQLTTRLGVLSYTELAPHLARRVEAVQKAIDDGAFDHLDLAEDLLLELHRRICGDLTPDFAGRWRDKDVAVGNHLPPPYFEVAQHMRNYTLDLGARIASLSPQPDDDWLETLAFAEGRLLSIHPFVDFNGRVTRVFIDWLTRRLQLPDIDPTPDPGAATDRYLQSLRAADKNDWRPLMAIWRERFEQGGRT